MDANRFDAATRDFFHSASRRRVLAGIAALVATTSILAEADAKSRNQKKKKLKRNSFGCVNVGQKCYGKSEACCSGICEGGKKHGKCVGHNVGSCGAGDGTCSESIACGPNQSRCYQTTGNAGYCGDANTCFCAACQKDADCLAMGFPPGSACVLCLGVRDGVCGGINGSDGTACVKPPV